MTNKDESGNVIDVLSNASQEQDQAEVSMQAPAVPDQMRQLIGAEPPSDQLPRNICAALISGTPDDSLSCLSSKLVSHFRLLGLRVQDFDSDVSEEEANSAKLSMAVALVWQSCSGFDELGSVLTRFVNKIHRETPKLVIVINQLKFADDASEISGNRGGAAALKREVESGLKSGDQWCQEFPNLFLIYKLGKPDQLELFLKQLLKVIKCDARDYDLPIFECISEIVPSSLKANVVKEGFVYRNSLTSPVTVAAGHSNSATCRGVLKNLQNGWAQPFAGLDSCEKVKHEVASAECYVNNGDGKALIISNRNFKDPSKQRRGADFDMVNLRDLLSRLGYKVTCKRDLEASDMKGAVRDFCNSAHGSSCILVILTHGKLGQLEGVDGEYLEERELLQTFGHCESLSRKPRLLIIQACRDGPLEGSDGTEMTDAGGSNYPERPLEEFGPHYVGGNFIAIDNSPSCAGLIVAHSTTPGMKAHRMESGSRFITALCMACHEYADKEDVLCLINRVNASMTQLGRLDEGGSPVPLPEQISRWIVQTSKKFYLIKTPEPVAREG